MTSADVNRETQFCSLLCVIQSEVQWKWKFRAALGAGKIIDFQSRVWRKDSFGSSLTAIWQ
jgi:hypothetical protein